MCTYPNTPAGNTRCACTRGCQRFAHRAYHVHVQSVPQSAHAQAGMETHACTCFHTHARAVHANASTDACMRVYTRLYKRTACTTGHWSISPFRNSTRNPAQDSSQEHSLFSEGLSFRPLLSSPQSPHSSQGSSHFPNPQPGTRKAA